MQTEVIILKNTKLVMIPGPTPTVASIQMQMARETASFKDPDFINDFKTLIVDLKQLLGTTGECMVVAGTGTLAMEMAIANTTKGGGSLLVVSHGYFGDRFVDMGQRRGLTVDVLSSEWGKAVPLKAIESRLSQKRYQAVTVTHVDTSTGTCASAAEIGEIVGRFDETLYILDGVCATGAEPEAVDAMGIDVLLTGSQKAFGVSPGLAILWAGAKAIARRKSLGTIPDSYMDFEKWIPIMHDPGKYWGTPPVNLIWALKESLRLVKEEGLENRCRRHKRDAEGIQAALEAMGFRILAEKGFRAATLSNVIYPEGIDDEAFRAILAEEGVVVAAGLGAYAGKAFRLGHMGHIDTHIIVGTLSAIERTLYRVGQSVEFGKALRIYMERVTAQA
jgi:aspartate aminotransferase-like enzyme